MRYIRILLIHLQRVLAQRMRSFVWFLMTVINPVILILFWHGALQNTGGSLGSWNESDFTTYYLVLMLASNILVIHIEEHISFYDIRLGYLSGQLVRPFSYYWLMFFEEMPYRILQGSFGIVAAIILIAFFKNVTFFSPSVEKVPLIALIITGALAVSFTFKMIIGLLAFWITQIDGIMDMGFILSLIYGGYIIPLNLLPHSFQLLIGLTPFPWITYYPTLALMGKLSPDEMITVICQQLIWLVGLGIVYKIAWSQGVKKFTAVGQ